VQGDLEGWIFGGFFVSGVVVGGFGLRGMRCAGAW
jgi:hypothetical protein